MKRLKPLNDFAFTSYHIYEDRTKEKLTDNLEICFIEMPKFKLENKDFNNPLHRWLSFLQDDIPLERLEELQLMDEHIKSAEEQLKAINFDEDARRKYEEVEKKIHDDISRMNGARREGELLKQNQLIVSFYQKGVALDTIANATELSIEEVQKILEEEGL